MAGKKLSEYHPFKQKSTWTPSSSNNFYVEEYLRKAKKEHATVLNNRWNVFVKPSMSGLEWGALQELRISSNIVILKADKGSQVVVMNLKDYRHQAIVNLSNEKTYEVLRGDPTSSLVCTINE